MTEQQYGRIADFGNVVLYRYEISFISKGRICMKKQKRRVLSLLLAVLVTLTMIPASFAADDLDGHWSQDAMETWVDYGVIKGYEDGSVRPDKSITRGELAVMLDRIMSYQNKSSNNFNDLGDSWYTDAILGASAAGIIGGYEDGTVRPEATISRQEAVVMIARVLGLHVAGTADNMFTDANEIGSWAKDAVDAMAAAGYIHGSNGQFRPTAGITRAEIVTILNNIFAGLCREGGSYTEDVDGSLVVNSSDVSLEGMTIKGDLIIAEGVAANSVVLDGVTVEGRIIVRGGGTGSNAVVITGDSVVDTVVVQRQDEAVEIEVQGNAQVNEIVASSGTESVTVSGTVDTVTVDDANTTVEIAGTVNTLSVTENAANADVTVAKGATVDSVTTVAENTTLNVSGTIKDVTVSENANNATVSTETGAKVESVTTSGAGTTVSGSGTVSKVEAAEGSTGTTVETGGTTIENNSSESVTTDKGSVDAGETGTTSGGTTSGGGSSSGGSSSGGHSHNYVDGVCTANDGAYDPTWAQVNSVETWNAAVEAGKNIVVTGNFEANAQLLIAKVITVNGNGKTITSKNAAVNAADSAGILVTAGAAIKNLTVSGPNSTADWDEGEYGIKVYNTTDVKLENVTVIAANAGIQVNSATVDLAGTITVSGNEFGGIEVCKSSNEDLSVGTLNIDTATIVCEDTNVPAIWIDGLTANAGVVTGADNLFAYQPNGEDQIYYFTKLTEIGTATIPNGMTLTVDNLTVTAGSTLTVDGTLIVNGTLTNNGTITGTGTVTAPGYAKSGNNWVKLFDGGFGTETNPYQIANLEQWGNIAYVATQGKSFLLTNDIELTSTEGMLTNFSGTLDGGNHSVTLPLSSASSSKWCAFALNATGKICNLVIHHQSGEAIPFVGYPYGESFTFENVDIGTADSNVVCHFSDNDNNESAYMVQSEAKLLTFKDCNNYLSYTYPGGNQTYTSAFVGGYSYAADSSIVFYNCWNYGDISMSHASLFIGNGSNMDDVTVTVTNSGNYGKILGYTAAKPFCAVSTDSFERNDANKTLNSGTYNQGTGSIYVLPKLEGFKASYDENGTIIIAAPTEAENIGHYNLTYAAYGKDAAGTTYLFNVVIEIEPNDVETNYKKYTMISTTSASNEDISLEDIAYTPCGSYGMRYAIKDNYLICDYGTYAGVNNPVTLNEKDPTVSVTAIDTNGEVCGIVVVE